MDIGILGAGIVGQTVGAKLAEIGHTVTLGTRRPEATDEDRGRAGSLADWLERAGEHGRVASYGEAAATGEAVINATPGSVTLDVLDGIDGEALADKILLDIANPLDFSQGFPPSLTVANTDSLAERIQRALPETRVVKALNTVTAAVMVAPESVGGGEHTLLLAGDDGGARASVAWWMDEWFGWRDILDLGPLSAARGMEAYLLLWVRAMGALDTPMFNIRIVR